MPAILPKQSSSRDSTGSLESALIDRFSELQRPEWLRAVHARRIAAAVLALAAVVIAFRGDPGSDHVSVVVAARDLQPGMVLTAQDLEIVEREAHSIPEGTQAITSSVVGRTLAGPTRAGEPLTDVRLLGPRLADAATGIEDARIVPLRLADPRVAGLLREGDLVDVLTIAPETSPGDDKNPGAAIIAAGAVVVLVTTPENDRNQAERIAMIALPRDEATRVAAASLTDAITVTFQ
ncbi:MAG: flagellar biosynthesis protein FlgA [Rhodococcus sp.]|nr:flagellar biosynthesis protein FlgA [Rhodococcus sp. (in: high G+C Gram-positive bacteria)]